MSVAICRTCLTEDASMQSICNTQLQDIYERISNTKLITEDSRSESVCHPCYSQLEKCHKFSVMAQTADSMLKRLYCNDFEIPQATKTTLRETRDSLRELKLEASDSPQDSPEDNQQGQLLHEDSVKDELVPVKVELISIEEWDGEIKVEETSANEESDSDRKCKPQLVGAPLKKPQIPRVNIKEEKNTKDSNLSKLFKCDTCEESFTLKSILKSHIKKHKQKVNACNNCGETFLNKYRLKKHMLCHTSDNDNTCVPNQCDITCSSNSKKHVKKEKSCSLGNSPQSHTEKSFNCHLCDKKFAHKTNLQTHIKIHVGEKLSACDRCGKTFPNGYQLKRHLRCHTGDKPYVCHVCNKACSDKGNLKKHIMIHAGVKPHTCPECNSSFTLKCNLQRHMRTHSGETPFLCDICQKPYPDASLLKRHLRIHMGVKPFVCEVCGKAFSDKDNLKKHMRLHNGEKPYACKLCDYKSAYGNCLKLHLAKKHS